MSVSLDPNAVRTFRTIYQRHYGFVCAVVRRMGVRSEAIEDAVQDSFLTAFRRWEDLPHDRSRPWLYGIARRVSSNYRRGEQRRGRKHEALQLHHPEAVEFEARAAAAQAVDKFLAALDERDRELFVLGEVEGFTGRELAEALRTRPSTLYGRLTKLRERFRVEVAAGDEALTQARQSRSLPKASGWAILLPQLSVPVTWLSPWMALGGMTKVAVAVSVVVVGMATVAASADRPRTQERPRTTVSKVTQEPVPSTSKGSVRPQPMPAPVVATPSISSPQVSATTQKPAPRRRPTPEAVGHDRLAQEAALVGALRGYMSSGDMVAALKTTHEYARRFPEGALVDAVAALRVEALCRSGKQAQARGEVRAFLSQHQGSPVARRVEQACRE